MVRLPLESTARVAAALTIVLAAVAIASPRILRGVRFSMNRQVPVEWMTWNRPIAQLFLWGFLMGLGFVTYTATLGWPLMVGVALVSPSPVLVGVAFGGGRGLVALVATGLGRLRPFLKFDEGWVRKRLDRVVGAAALVVVTVATQLPK